MSLNSNTESFSRIGNNKNNNNYCIFMTLCTCLLIPLHLSAAPHGAAGVGCRTGTSCIEGHSRAGERYSQAMCCGPQGHGRESVTVAMEGDSCWKALAHVMT